MTARITLEIDGDDATETFADIAKAMKKTDDAAGGLNKTLKGFGNTLGDVRDKVKSIDLVGKFNAAATAMRGVTNVGRDIAQMIQRIGENTPAMDRLNESFFRLEQAGQRIGSDPRIQRWLDSMAQGIDEHVIPALSRVPELYQRIHESVTRATVATGEYLGLFREGTGEQLEGMLKKDRDALEDDAADVQQKIRDKKRGGINDRVKDVRAAEEDRAFSAMVKQEESKKKLNQLADDYIAHAKNIAEREARTAEEQRRNEQEVERALRRFTELRGRLVELTQQEVEAEKRLKEELRKAGEDFGRDMEKAEADRARRESEANKAKMADLQKQFQGGMTGKEFAEQQQDIASKTQEKIGQIRQQMNQAFMKGEVQEFHKLQQEETRLVADAAKQQKELREKFAKEGNVLDKLKGQFSQKDVMKEVERQRLEKARQDVIDKARASGKIDQHGKAIGKSMADRARAQRDLNRQLAKARRDAQKKLRADMRKMQRPIRERFTRGGEKIGKDPREGIGEKEMSQASNNLANKTIDMARQTGQISADTAAALRSASEAIEAEKQQVQNQGQEIKAIGDKLSQLAEEVRMNADAAAADARSRAMRH